MSSPDEDGVAAAFRFVLIIVIAVACGIGWIAWKLSHG